MSKVKIVVATREDEAGFYKNTATGKSLSFLRFPFVEVCLFANNSRGLPELYNEVIQDSINDPCMLIFMHDDILIIDYFFIDQVLSGLSAFKVLGVAGNRRRVPRQPCWAFVDINFTWDDSENLSGVVGHGTEFPPNNLSVFGAPMQQVKLLDGLILCVLSETLHDNKIWFDERFAFDFYDMDFCRQAEEKNISCGTWPISLVHGSEGNFGTPSWRASYQTYLDKWGD